jgi:photosystem II stability/assembly factor-like uncharacterized protein
MKISPIAYVISFLILLIQTSISAQEYINLIESGIYPITVIQKSAEEYFNVVGKGKGTGYKQYKRWEYNAKRMADDTGYLPSDELYLREWERLNTSQNSSSTFSNRSNDYWEELGPNYNVSSTSWNPGHGRITSFAVEPQNENHIIVGAETGGVWKSTTGGVSWKPLNDFHSNIAVYSVAMDPTNRNIYYFGSTNGKVFKSIDAGATWAEIGRAGTSRITRILIHSVNPNIIYICAQNSGFYRSDNAGASWIKVIQDALANDIEFKPGNPNIVYAAGEAINISRDNGLTYVIANQSSGNKFLFTITSPTELAGGYLAVDNNFTSGHIELPVFPNSLQTKLILYDDENASTNNACVSPQNANEIAGNIVVIRRSNCTFVSKVLKAQSAGARAVVIVNNVEGSPFGMGGQQPDITIPAIMISKDDGELIISSLTTKEISATIQQPFYEENTPKLSSKVIGVSPASPNIMYILESEQGRFGALYKSNDEGESFTKFDHGDSNFFGYSTFGDDDRGQAPRNMDIAVHPNNADEVHIGGILTWQSVDGGANFECTSDWIPDNAASENIGYCHADINTMLFYKNKLYVSSDGGIYKANNTTNLTLDFYEDISEGLGVRQFYKMGVSKTEPFVLSAGAQDNGTTWYSDLTGWQDWLGADGMETFVDKDNSLILFGTTQNGGMYRKNEFDNIFSISRPDNKIGNWVTPFEQDPLATETIYVGYDNVYKSTDSGDSWTSISQTFGQNLDLLKIAPSDNNTMYSAYDTQLFKTTTGGNGNWTPLIGFSGSINFIAIHPLDPNKIAIATTSSDKVYISSNGGTNWTSYKKNLPNFSALSLAWQEGPDDGLYVGMNYGVYYTDKNMTSWLSFSNQLPNVIVNELEINYRENKIYAATYGRGLWASDLYKNTPDNTEDQLELLSITIVPNPVTDRFTIHSDVMAQIESDITIFDGLGKLLKYEKNILLNNFALNISDLAPSHYYVKINNKKGVFTKKVTKL